MCIFFVPKTSTRIVFSADKLVNKAASILRMLYISDLRELQDAANDILITLQAYTADPKTNTAAGKVGR